MVNFFFKIDLRKNIFHFIIFFSLYFLTIYLSGERTSFFLLLILIFLIFLIFKNLRIIFSYSFIIFIFLIFFISFTKLGTTDHLNRMFVKTFNQLTDNKLTENSNENNQINFENISGNLKIYSNHHEGHIKLALKLFQQNKIFGAGPKGFRYHCRKVNYNPDYGICSTHPHNILIQILAELGLIGLFFYVIAALFVIYNLIKLRFNNYDSEKYLSFYAISLGLIINFFPLVPSGNFFNNWISIYIYYNVGLYLYSFNKCISK